MQDSMDDSMEENTAGEEEAYEQFDLPDTKPSARLTRGKSRRSLAPADAPRKREKQGRKEKHTANRKARMDQRKFKDLETTLQMLGIDGEPGSRVTRSPHAPLVNADDLKTRLSSMDSITQAAIPRSRRTRIRSPKRRSPKRRSSITTKPSSNPSLTKPSSSTAIMPPNIKPSSSPAIMPTLIKPPPPTPSQTVSNALALAHTAIVRAGLDSRDCLVRFDQIWKSFLRANLDQPSCGIVPLPSPPCPSPASTSGLTTPTCLTCTRCQRQMNDDSVSKLSLALTTAFEGFSLARDSGRPLLPQKSYAELDRRVSTKEQIQESMMQFSDQLREIIKGNPQEDKESAFLVAAGKALDLKHRLEVLPASCEDSWTARGERLSDFEDAIADLTQIKTSIEQHSIQLRNSEDAVRYAEILKDVTLELQAFALSCSEALREGLQKIRDKPPQLCDAFKLSQRFLQCLKTLTRKKDQVVYATEKDLKTFRTALGEMLAKLIVTMTESLTDLQELHFRPDALQLKYGGAGKNNAHEVQDRCRQLTTGWHDLSEMIAKVSAHWPEQATKISVARCEMLLEAAKLAESMQRDIPDKDGSNGQNERIKHSSVGSCPPTAGVWCQSCDTHEKAGPTVTDDDMQAQSWLPPLAFALLTEASKAGGALWELAEHSPQYQRCQFETLMEQLSEALYNLATTTNLRLGSMVVDPSNLAQWALQTMEDQTTQAVMFVMGLDKCILGGGEVAMRHHMKLKDATVGVVNSILYVRRLIKQKGGLENPRPLPALRSDSQSNLVAANRHPSKGKKAQKPPTKSPTQQSPSHPRGPKAVQNGKISGRTSPVYTYDQYTGRKVLISSSPEDNIQGRNAGREIQKGGAKHRHGRLWESMSSSENSKNDRPLPMEMPKLGESPNLRRTKVHSKPSDVNGVSATDAKPAVDLTRPTQCDKDKASQSSDPVTESTSELDDRNSSPTVQPRTPSQDTATARRYTASSNFDDVPASGNKGVDSFASKEVQEQPPSPVPLEPPKPESAFQLHSAKESRQLIQEQNPLAVFGPAGPQLFDGLTSKDQGAPIRFWGTFDTETVSPPAAVTPRVFQNSPFAPVRAAPNRQWSSNRLSDMGNHDTPRKTASNLEPLLEHEESKLELKPRNGLKKLNGHSKKRAEGKNVRERKSGHSSLSGTSRPATPALEILNGRHSSRIRDISKFHRPRINTDRQNIAFTENLSDPTQGFFFSQAAAALNLARASSELLTPARTPSPDLTEEEDELTGDNSEPLGPLGHHGVSDECLRSLQARYNELMAWRAADPIWRVRWEELKGCVIRVLDEPGGSIVREKQIGEGSFGIVLEGYYHKAPVAIKLFSIKSEKTLADTLQLFKREVELQKGLGGFQYIVSISGVCCEVPPPLSGPFDASKINLAIVMELCRLGSLRSVLKSASEIAKNVPADIIFGKAAAKPGSTEASLMRHKGLRPYRLWSLRIEMAKQAASAVEFMHSRDVAHRDLTSSNILVTDRFEAKVADFGLSKSLSEQYESHFTLGVINSLCWAAPEKLSGRKVIDAKAADVFRGWQGFTSCHLLPNVFISYNLEDTEGWRLYTVSTLNKDHNDSFGVVLWEFITLKAPWSDLGDDFDEDVSIPAGHVLIRPDRDQFILRNVPQGVRLEFPDPDTIQPPCQEVSQVIDLAKRCWAQDPKERPSIEDVTSELDRILKVVRIRDIETSRQQQKNLRPAAR